MWNELRVEMQFSSPYLGLSRMPMKSGLNASRRETTGCYVIGNSRVPFSEQLFENLVLLKIHSLARTTLQSFSELPFTHAKQRGTNYLLIS